MKFAFVHAEKASFPVAALCRLLGVTRQGYYAYAKRLPGERRKGEVELRERLKELHEESRLDRRGLVLPGRHPGPLLARRGGLGAGQQPEHHLAAKRA